MSTFVSIGQITITDTNDSANLYLSLDNITIPTNSDGSGGTFTLATTTASVSLSMADDSNNWIFSVVVTGLTGTSSNNNRTYAVSGFTSNATVTGTVVFTATKKGSSLSKTFTISKALAGQNGITGSLTNETMSVTCDADGSNPDLSGANGYFNVFYGTTNLAGQVLFLVTDQTNCTGSILPGQGYYAVIYMSPTSDTASLTMKAIWGAFEIYKTFTLSKSKKGNTGDQGIPATLPVMFGSPSGSGMFLNSTHFGYYASGAWRTYLDDSGNFQLGNGATGPGLAWNQAAGTLGIRGKLYASDINTGDLIIGGATFTFTNGTSTGPNIDNTKVKVGGRNIIANSSFTSNINGWGYGGNHTATLETTTKFAGYNSIKIVATGAGGSANWVYPSWSSSDIQPINGQQYAISFWATGSGTIHCEMFGSIGAFNSTVAASWAKFSGVVTASSSAALYIWLTGAGTVYIANFKMELGPIATDYSPAPEDTPFALGQNVNVVSVNSALAINNYLDIKGNGARLNIGNRPLDDTGYSSVITTPGIAIGKDSSGNSNALFYKDTNNYLKYDTTDGLTIRGPLNAGDITVGTLHGIDVVSNSFSTGGGILVGDQITSYTTPMSLVMEKNSLMPDATVGSPQKGFVVGKYIFSINQVGNGSTAFTYTGKSGTDTLTGVTWPGLPTNITRVSGNVVMPAQAGIVIDKVSGTLVSLGDDGSGTNIQIVKLGGGWGTDPLLSLGASTTSRPGISVNYGGSANTGLNIQSSYGGTGAYIALSDGASASGGPMYGGNIAVVTSKAFSTAIGLTVSCSHTGSATGSIGVQSSGGTWDFYAIGDAAGYNSFSSGSYGPFTGAHDGLVIKSFVAEVGDIIVDKSIFNHKNISNTIAVNEISTKPKQKNVVGVFINRRELDPLNAGTSVPYPWPKDYSEEYDAIIFNALGEGQINVCKEGGNFEAGDYICSSSIPGKGMKQDDDILHNYTIAKIRENCIWEDGDNEIKMVACIYLAG